MSLLDDAKLKLEEAKKKAEEVANDVADKADILKQRAEGEVDKTIAEAKIQDSKDRDKEV